MKKLIVILISILFLIGLAACDGTSLESKENPENGMDFENDPIDLEQDGETLMVYPTENLKDEPTGTPIPTPTLEPTNTPIPTPEPTSTPMPTPEPTNTPIPTPEPTSTPLPTPIPEPEVQAGKALIVYFSWSSSGNTEKMANVIKEQTGGDIYELIPLNPYPENYTRCTEVALEERDNNARPEIKDPLASLEGYDRIYIGYPNMEQGFNSVSCA